MRLVLFDIDGAILWSDGAGRRAMTRALTEVFGQAGPTEYRYDGKTDPQIVRDLMRHAGHDDAWIDAHMDALMARYLEGLRSELAPGNAHAHLFDGVDALIDALDARDDVVLGLLTGNLEEGAVIKLRAVGLDPARFRVGAFGSDHHHRPELPAVAQRRARERLGLDVAGERIIVIGDTPADIECGRSIGAKAIGVATGRFPVEELARHEPFAVFEDLSDTSLVLETILRA